LKFPFAHNLEQIANLINAEFVGDSHFPILGLNEIHVVEPGDIVFVDHPKYYEKALKSAATIVPTAVTFGDTDVTSRYLLDSGQRDNFYDISRLTLKPRMSIPNGNLLVIYDYFEHQDGDFFTVDSYAGVTYEQIPYYLQILENDYL
jgi:hypothetical protein